MKTAFKTLVLLLIAGGTLQTYACKHNKENGTTLIAEAVTPKPDKKTIQVALLLDTSNSMDGLINQAKAQLWDIVNELSYARCEHIAPELEIAIYEYGNDRLSSEEGYIKQVIGFTNDLDDISEKLFSLTTNGGEEFCGQVIQTALKQLSWGKNKDALRMLFIAGNEPFTQGQVNYADATTNAIEKDVIVNTIFCGNYEQGIQGKWKDGAIRTKGEYMAIDHNRKIVQIITPYDDEILILNRKLNKTYVPYGKRGSSKMSMQAEQDANAASINQEVKLKRAVSKSSRLYKNSSWDLVDAAENEDFEVSELKEEELPATLQGKSDAEIKSYIKTKTNERKTVQTRIQELSKKRTSYIANKSKETGKSGLENAMIRAIKKQAALKNYNWKK
ncbi:vWA domain-containing protein [Ascidiimonas sp. W6]|uniref:vWA domain-containing protein n=1 Tax=Ascidiimonas meishanensis TaxID=3128903 RepID=UPI0030EBE7D1